MAALLSVKILMDFNMTKNTSFLPWPSGQIQRYFDENDKVSKEIMQNDQSQNKDLEAEKRHIFKSNSMICELLQSYKMTTYIYQRSVSGLEF